MVGNNSPLDEENFLNRAEIGHRIIGVNCCYYMVIHLPCLGIYLAEK
jgi:hypothetical protein